MNLHLSHLWCEEAILPSRVFFSALLSLLGWQFVLWAVLSCLFCFFHYKRQIVWMLALLTSPLHPSQRGSSSQYLHFCCHILLQQTGLLVCLHSLWLRSPVSQTCCPRPGVWLLLDVASMAIIEHPYVCVPLFTYCVFCDFWHQVCQSEVFFLCSHVWQHRVQECVSVFMRSVFAWPPGLPAVVQCQISLSGSSVSFAAGLMNWTLRFY